jgi:hypothetical protein
MLPTEVSPNMSRVVGFFVLGLLVCLSATRATADRLIYAVSYQETTASLRAHPHPNLFSATTNEKLAMLRRYRKTEIHAISPSDSKSSLLFSDEGMNFEIEPFNDAGNPLLPGKAFLPGVEREWRTTPTPGAYESPQAIYELSLDGSNHFRRLFETLPNSTYLSVNLSGSRAALRAYVKDKYMFYVYDTKNWNVLHSWDIQKLLHDHCPDCQPLSDGWVADGTLFISLDLVDEDSIEQEDKDVPGIFFVGEDGTEVGGVSREMGKLHLPGYVRDDSILPELIGQLPDGSYLFRDYARKAGPLPKPPLRMSSFLVIAKPGSTMQKQIPLQVSVGVHQFQLSPSGRFVAFMEDRQVANYKTERHLWTKNLETGEEKELLLMPETPPQPTDPIPVFRVMGWEGEK